MKFLKFLLGCGCAAAMVYFAQRLPELRPSVEASYFGLDRLGVALGALVAAGLVGWKLFQEAFEPGDAYSSKQAKIRQLSEAARARVTSGLARPARAEKARFPWVPVALAVAVIAGCGGAYYSLRPVEAPVAPAPLTLEAAQRQAIQRYPDIGVIGSLLNREYVSRYERYKREQPNYFADAGWPLRLADECGRNPVSRAP